MRRASVTIGTLLVLGAATVLVNCGGDDSTSTAGTGGSGGSGGSSATGGSGGSTGGSGGSGGSTGGASGAGGAGMQDSGADQASGGSAGAGGSAGKAGASGAGGAAGAAGSAGAAGAGKAGASGAGGAAGGGQDGGKAGGAGASMDASGDANTCPATQPAGGSGPCDVEVDCDYGSVRCTCLDPGPNGSWACVAPPGDSGGGNDSGMCPADVPSFGDPCPDSGFRGPCLYDSGHTECTCDPTSGWGCIRH